MRGGGMGKKHFSGTRLQSLAARIDTHLQEFMDEEDAPVAGARRQLAPEDYIGERMGRKKRREQVNRAAMATGAVAGGVALAKHKDQIRAGAQKVREAVPGMVQQGREAYRTAVFRGMRKTAEQMGKGSRMAGKAAREIPWQHQGLRKAAGTVSEKLAKGSRKLRKGSMKFFWERKMLAEGLVRLEAKLRRLEENARR
jgi:hypothetical protein